MKHLPKILIITVLVISALTTLFIKSTKAPFMPTNPPTPVAELPKPKTPAKTPQQNQTNQPSSTTSSNPPTVHPKNLSPSQTLNKYPDAPQIPYYLMGSVNDPYYASSWHLSKVQANRGWDLSTGSTTTTVAVIDTGFELNHEDLTSRWYVNQDESGQTQIGDSCWTGTPQNKSTNNCDDDNNGYIDDYRGYDFYYDDNNPQAGQVNPSGEATHHGTMVAGMVGASANNNKGSSGIDQNTKILPLQIFSDEGEAFTNSIVSAIDYAVAMHVNVINLSLGSDQPDQALRDAINRAISNDIVVVASSGNCALNDEPFCNGLTAPGRMAYPALYPNVIAVGATTNTDQRANYSSYGAQLDVVAPGSSVGPLPVYNNGSVNSYATGSGTSFSAPLVSGIISLLIAQNPSLTPAQVESIIIESSDTVAPMFDSYRTDEYGYGRVNAHKATLLGLAKMQDNLLGATLDSPNQPAVGRIWRASSGNMGNDEVALVGCRIFASQTCGASIQNNGTTYWLKPKSYHTKGDTQYFFAPNNSAPSGTWQISVHNNQYATNVSTLIK